MPTVVQVSLVPRMPGNAANGAGPGAAAVAWIRVAMANGAGAGGCNKGSVAKRFGKSFRNFRLFANCSFSLYYPFITVPGRPFIRFIPATLSYTPVFRSAAGSGVDRRSTGAPGDPRRTSPATIF